MNSDWSKCSETLSVYQYIVTFFNYSWFKSNQVLLSYQEDWSNYDFGNCSKRKWFSKILANHTEVITFNLGYFPPSFFIVRLRTTYFQVFGVIADKWYFMWIKWKLLVDFNGFRLPLNKILGNHQFKFAFTSNFKAG